MAHIVNWRYSSNQIPASWLKSVSLADKQGRDETGDNKYDGKRSFHMVCSQGRSREKKGKEARQTLTSQWEWWLLVACEVTLLEKTKSSIEPTFTLKHTESKASHILGFSGLAWVFLSLLHSVPCWIHAVLTGCLPTVQTNGTSPHI